jgi:hypothetical protein
MTVPVPMRVFQSLALATKTYPRLAPTLLILLLVLAHPPVMVVAQHRVMLMAHLPPMAQVMVQACLEACQFRERPTSLEIHQTAEVKTAVQTHYACQIHASP